MKRNFTVKALFLSAAIAVASLVNKTNAQVEFGFIGGLNMANMKASGYKLVPDSARPTFSGITRYRVGIFADMPLNNYFSLNPELAYSVKGSVQRLDTTASAIDFSGPPIAYTEKNVSVSNFDLGYIELPVLFRFSTPLGRPSAMYPFENSVKPFYLDIFAGPYFGFLLMPKNESSTTITRSSDNDTSEAYNFSTKVKSNGTITQIGKIDYGAVAGLGFKWRFNRKSYLYLDVRYTMGFANLNKGYWDRIVADQSDPDPLKWKVVVESPKIKNTGTLTFSLGFITNFSKRRYFNLYKEDRNRP
ncbi:MAG TPA: porin family protein [Bacteroidia bacterium]|nr:porin family protein [Bacteroidia bacterium]